MYPCLLTIIFGILYLFAIFCLFSASMDPTLPQFRPDAEDFCAICCEYHKKRPLERKEWIHIRDTQPPDEVSPGLYISKYAHLETPLTNLTNTCSIFTAERYIKRTWSKTVPKITHVLSLHSGRCEERARLKHVSTSKIIHKQIVLSDRKRVNIIEHFPGKFLAQKSNILLTQV